MRAHQLRSPLKRKVRRRVGRGNGSGRGTYSGRGIKGQKARSGGGRHPAFEGGQLAMVKGLPKLKGFTNVNRQAYHLVNVAQLTHFAEGTHVTPDDLVRDGVLKNVRLPVKILGNGDLDRPLTVVAHKFSKGAREKIQSVGGTVKEL